MKLGWHDLPKSKNATTEQTQYIEGVFNKLQDHAYDNDLEDGYKTVIDAFVDFMLVNELCSNSDVYQSSTFFIKTEMENCEQDQFGILI
jgi:hypothetical protein